MLGWPGSRPWTSGTGRAAAAIGAAVLLGALAAPAHAARVNPAAPRTGTAAADSPAGFWYGTDSTTISIGGPAPYTEPVIGGPYGGYIGMTGNWATWQGCRTKVVW